jgi:hypothetical protein
MIYNNIEFHNVDHLQVVDGMTGLKLERFPQAFSRQLGNQQNQNGRFAAERIQGCELRFVTDAIFFELSLTAMMDNIDILIYCGDLLHTKYTLEAGKCTVLHIGKHEIYDGVDISQLTKDRFAPNVWRVLIGLGGNLYFNYLDTFGHEHRPPQIDEKPSIRWAAYGSSITCGSVSRLYSNSYINQAAIRLGYDVFNKGLSGSCYCENFVADYLAQLEVDILTLELGVNMVNFFDEVEFENRIIYLLKKLQSDSTADKIYVIDMFPNKGAIAKDINTKYYINYRAFKQIVRKVVKELADNRIINIQGEKVLKDYSYLSTDLLHPSDDGHIRMGENLAAMMKQN